MIDACVGCGLAAGCKTPYMGPDLSGLVNGRCDVLIIGEAPGAEEDSIGKPFVGPSGALLRTIVDDVGLTDYGVAYTNVVRCRPPNNKLPDKAVKVCAPSTLAEIDNLNPRLVLLLGNVPLKAVMGESGITAWRGSTMERDGRTYVPAFHPAYILRNNSELPTLVNDVQKVYDLLSGSGESSILDDYDVGLVAGADDAREMQDAILRAGTVSWDTESRNAEPYAPGARMIMLSFAVNRPTKQAWAVLPDHPAVATICKGILQNPKLKIICHNAKYDQHVVWAQWGIEVPGIVGDSMLASWLLDPTPGRHGLKHLAGRMLGLYEYNSELDAYHAAHPESNPAAKKPGDQSLVPIDILAPYAAIDAISTLEVHKLLYKKMSPVQKVLYNQLLIQSSTALFCLERNGAPIDNYIAERYINVYSAIQDQQYELMLHDNMVQKFIARRQALLDKAYDDKYRGKKTRAKRPTFTFNPNSPLQMRELLFSKRYLGLPADGQTEGGDDSTKWEYLKPYANDNPFLQAFHYYSLMDKALGTYLRPSTTRWQDADGRVRSTYSVHGTVSGRLSSRDPNLQNIPTPEKEPGTVLAVLPVKNIFTCSDWGDPGPELTAQYEDMLGPYVVKGGLIMCADFSGMELRTIASLSQCKRMLEIFERGEDVHRIVSSGIFGVPVEEVTKEMRYRGKWTNWTLLYGGSEHTFYRLYGIPLEEGKRFIKVYYDLFPEIKEFHEDILEKTRALGYVESAFGFRRYMPYINDRKNHSMRASNERETLNHPIQSVASHILMMALIILNDVFRMNDIQARIINTVHDSIVLDVPLYEVPTVARLVKRCMEGLKDLYKSWFPGMDLDWFTCPLVVDLEVGSHYGSLVEYHMEENDE